MRGLDSKHTQTLRLQVVKGEVTKTENGPSAIQSSELAWVLVSFCADGLAMAPRVRGSSGAINRANHL